MKICVLDKGWVLVGNLEEDGEGYILTNGKVIRRWGTTEGIGELGFKGPLADTVLDPLPITRFSKNVLIMKIDCQTNNW